VIELLSTNANLRHEQIESSQRKAFHRAQSCLAPAIETEIWLTSMVAQSLMDRDSCLALNRSWSGVRQGMQCLVSFADPAMKLMVDYTFVSKS
jgi:hypothetical protein